MKSMTYAQKADLVNKVRKVLDSCTRKAQLDAAGRYVALAEKATKEPYPDVLGNDIRKAWSEALGRIKHKPRYWYDWKLSKPVHKTKILGHSLPVHTEREQRLRGMADEQRRGMMSSINQSALGGQSFLGQGSALSVPFSIHRDLI